jgi:hypothetical protein
MDLPLGALVSGLVLGLLGTALFIYGKKAERAAPALAGIVLCVAPVLVASLLWQWVIAAGCLAGVWYGREA